MDAAIAEALSFYLAAAPAHATVATEAVAQECFTHAAGQVVPKAMYDQLMSNYIALSGKAVDAEKIMAPITLLRRCLERMESDWLQIESEWGPTDGGLDADIANGNADEIRDLRALLASPAAPSVSAWVPNAVALAYGLLWHVNAGMDAPADVRQPSLTPEKAAYEARKVLRDLMTKDQRGDGINAARVMLTAPTASGEGEK